VETPSTRIAVLGEALIDLVPAEAAHGSKAAGNATTAAQFVARPGGSPYNVAIGLARLGRATSLLARLSNTAFGRILRAQAEAEGIDLHYAVDATQPTTLAVVTLDPQARASYDFYVDGTADWQWTTSELNGIPPLTRVLHFGSLAAWTPPGDAAILALARRLRAGNEVCVSYDPNVRPPLLGEPEVARARIEAGVAAAHLVKASQEDVAWLYPSDDLADVAQNWLGLGALLVVITDGPDGARAYTRGGSLHRPGRPVKVVDTVGAGDAFTAGLLNGLVRRGRHEPPSLERLPQDVLAEIVDEAILVSALTCERAGANPPRLVGGRADPESDPDPDAESDAVRPLTLADLR
jgi:fructokinase